MSSVAPEQTAIQAVAVDAARVSRLSQPGPCYTTYPGTERFGDDFGYRDYLQAVAGLRTRGARHPLSLSVHIPFCDTAFHDGACDRIVAFDRARTVTYLGYLKREIMMQGQLFAGMNQLGQLHLGAGRPTCLSDLQMDDLMQHLQRWFAFAADACGEYSIEVDPRSVSPQRVHALRSQGFNRISLHMQDVDDAVACAADLVRLQRPLLVIIDAARNAGFRSVGVDLHYRLPGLTRARIGRTLELLAAAGPDRIGFHDESQLPQRFGPPRGAQDDKPAAGSRLEMLAECIARLGAADYAYIGMDQFARAGDALSTAQRQGRLHRNLQGYSTHAESDQVGCGVCAISAVAGTCSQNHTTLDAYYDCLDNNELPTARGIRLGTDDLLRRFIIQMLMCNFELSLESIEDVYSITFATYFAAELARLRAFEKEGLLRIDGQWLNVTASGRMMVPAICEVFDRYLPSPGVAQRGLPLNSRSN